MTIGPIIGASAKIAEYFGLIEGVNTMVTKLIHQSFLSAKTNLEYARYAEGQNQKDYILQAKSEFIRAVAVEDNENKILALVGLSMCQNFLGEISNAQSTMNKISCVELTRSETAKYIALGTAGFSIGTIGAKFIAAKLLPFSSLQEREIYFQVVKNTALSINRTLIQ